MNQLNRQPDYRFYATLLDSYQWYLSSEKEEAFQEFIDKLNRVPFVSEAAEKGTAFNEVVDMVIKGEVVTVEADMYIHGRFGFDKKIVDEVVLNLPGAIPQVRTSALLQTERGLVELYGYIDELLPACVVVDIKTTSSYTLPKYLKNWQHIVYPYCLKEHNNTDFVFSYLITDFKEVYTETYQYKEDRDLPRLKNICEELIGFIEQHRHLITDTKLFQDPELLAA